ncbi:MAG: MBL fold metallo-hydrolase, partial [Candidatus Hydrogenedentes bacterium]|nr:MBL fold metallo-hydrolase [Candidatus Hydrogenedentota bacterium]
AHGFTGIEAPTHRPPDENTFILDYAQSKGMLITYHAGALEGFGRDKPPAISVYSPEYAEAVRARAEKALAPLKEIKNLYNVFTYQDEPFHWGPKSFGYSEAVKTEFQKRYGYDLPPDLASIKEDPKKWLDVINFRTANFPDGWNQVYPIIKAVNPDFKVTMTHDSHNTFGAGYGSHAEIAIDDVFHWGGDFADLFVFDLYPYMDMDYRFGEPSVLRKPRISQTHYTFAQMRALTTAFDKDLGFWVGTYNPAWFKNYIGPELAAMHWSEQEMAMTAIAHGADYLLTGYKIPIEAKHWDTLGKGMRLVQKAGARLLDAPRVKAKACMLFPRTQYVQLQQEYFNVGLSFELFLRAFGELDIIHEEQILQGELDDYEILTLFDVAMLPEAVAVRIADFTRKGGTVIADCLPQSDAYKAPLSVMAELFGAKDATTDRILRTGHWIPRVTSAPGWAYRPENAPEETAPTDTLSTNLLGREFKINLTSLRPFTLTTGTLLAKTASGTPALSHRKVGEGNAYLLGFCLQDTYFKTWQEDDIPSHTQLRDLLRAITHEAEIQAHVYSSNPDIEASIRANADEGFLFVINHESPSDSTTVTLRDLAFDIGRILSLETGEAIPFEKKGGAVTLNVTAPRDGALLLHVLPAEKAKKGPAEDNQFTLWQLPNQTPTQIMSYVMQTQRGKLIVLDGGMPGDAPYLANFLKERGNEVEAWFISHPHQDHFNALREILKKPGDLKIKTIYGSLPDPAWIGAHSSEDEQHHYNEFLQTAENAGHRVEALEQGQYRLLFKGDGCMDSLPMGVYRDCIST